MDYRDYRYESFGKNQYASHHPRVKTDTEMEMVLEKMEKIKKQGEREGRFLKVGILFGNEDQTVILNIILKHFS